MARLARWLQHVPPGRFLAWTMLLGFIPRLALLLAVPVRQSSDFLWDTNLALALAAGQGYSDGGVPTAFWPPGWPGFLGLLFTVFGPNQIAGQVANLLIATVTIPLVWWVGTRIFPDGRVGKLAALAVAIMPNQIAYVPLLSTEIFYEPLLLLGIILLFRKGRIAPVLAGLVFGLASLTKAQTPLIPALVLGVAFLYRWDWADIGRTIRKGLAVYVVMACVIAPWTIRNYMIFHTFILVSSNSGVTLLTGNNPHATGDYSPMDPSFTDLSLKTVDQVETGRVATQRAVAWIKANPAAFIALMPKKAWRLWGPDGEAEWIYQAGYAQYEKYQPVFRALRYLNQGFYFAMALLALPMLRVLFHRTGLSGSGQIPEQTGWVLCAYATLVSMVYSGQSRYHFVLIPWVAIYAAQTLVLLWDRRIVGQMVSGRPAIEPQSASRRPM